MIKVLNRALWIAVMFTVATLATPRAADALCPTPFWCCSACAPGNWCVDHTDCCHACWWGLNWCSDATNCYCCFGPLGPGTF